MTLGADDRGFLLVDSRDATDDDRVRLGAGLARLSHAGWRLALRLDDLDCLIGPRSTLQVRQIQRRHLLIGDWHGEPALAARIAVARTSSAVARAAVGGGWGRYVLGWRADEGGLGVLRDPSGTLDCLWWRRGGLRLVSSEPPEAADSLLPQDLSVDWPVVAEIALDPGLASDRLALKGLNAVAPGECVRITEAGAYRSPVWTPSQCVGRPWDDRPDALRRVVDEAVLQLAGGHERLIGEISGGLDSAIVTSSLAGAGLGGRAAFVNFYGDWGEGDERRFAFEAAALSGLALEAARKPVAAVTPDLLAPLGQGVRPGLQGVDVAYDRDVAHRLDASGATGLLTGQGGDAVFFQAPDPRIVVDRRRRDGLMAVRPAYWAQVARWTRHSAWTIADLALRPPKPTAPTARQHVWLADADPAYPAKYGQILRLANCQLFWGDCLRSRSGELVHPLLSQPVMEHCLALPIDRLTCGVRDRGLARLAFADRVPASILQRRDKGDLSQFYGHVLRRSLPEIRPFLMEGRLVAQHVLDRDELEAALTPDQLLQSQTSNRHLLHAVLETWVRRWSDRIAARRRAEIGFKPGDIPAV